MWVLNVVLIDFIRKAEFHTPMLSGPHTEALAKSQADTWLAPALLCI